MATDKNTTNIIPLGPCEVRYNTVNLGHTIGGVNVRITSHWKTIVVDDYGNTPVDDFERGMEIEIDVPLGQYDLEQLKIALPNYAQHTPDNLRLNFGDKVGDKITKYRLVVDPEDARELPVVVYLAAVTNQITIAYTQEAEKIIQVTFKGYIDESRAVGDRLFRIGGGSS